MAECILFNNTGGIDPDDLTATAAQVLEGYTAGVNGSDEPVEGTIPIQPTAQKATALGVNDKGLWYKITPGYYGTDSWGHLWVYRTPEEVSNTIGLTAAKIAAGQTILGIEGNFSNDANAIAANILASKTTYIKGKKVTGTMIDRNIVDSTIGGINSSYPSVAIHKTTANPQIGSSTVSKESLFSMLVPTGYYNGNSYVGTPINKVAITLNLTAAKLLQGQTVCGITGTATNDATATAPKILEGDTAYVKGIKISGTMVNQASSQLAKKLVVSDNHLYYRFPVGAYLGTIADGCTEIKATYASVATALELTSEKIVNGQTVCGVSGSAPRIKRLAETWVDESCSFTPSTYPSVGFEIENADGITTVGQEYPYAVVKMGIKNNGTNIVSPIWCCLEKGIIQTFKLPLTSSTTSLYVGLVLSRDEEGCIRYKCIKGTNSGTFHLSLIICAGTDMNLVDY